MRADPGPKFAPCRLLHNVIFYRNLLPTGRKRWPLLKGKVMLSNVKNWFSFQINELLETSELGLSILLIGSFIGCLVYAVVA